ncbi:unnamed protein product [Rotaria sordida]|uniref:TIR domain-containing protein n=1 Tax=Rotaria sordida TaxID=392033 RepID=A0A814J541_9BILA|nr:unnamed protein product [Rotaria sordida]CAF3795988.1 unnamed protein product [Rotaria sordida]
MVVSLNSKQIDVDVLLNSGLNDHLSIDEIIQKLNEISFDLISNYLIHDFFILKFFSRINEILQQWNNDNRIILNENDSITLRCGCNLILQMSNLMNNQLENNKILLNTIKICLNNISSFGYYINASNQEEDSNLASFDCLIQAYGKIKCKVLVESVARCAASRFSEGAFSGLCGFPLNNTEHFLLITCPDYVLNYDEENGKYAHFIFDQMYLQYAKVFRCPYGNINDLIDNYSFCLVSPLRLIAFAIRSLELKEKQSFKDIAMKILEYDIINLYLDEKNFTWKKLVHSSLKILLEIGRSFPYLINDIHENQTFFTKLLDNLLKLSNDQENENIQLQAFELIALIVSEEEFSTIVDINKVVKLFVKKFIEAVNIDNEEYNALAEELLYGLESMIDNNIIREQLVEQNSLPYLIKYAKKWSNNESSLKIIYAIVFTTKGKEELKKEQYKDFIDHIKCLYLSNKEEIRQAAHGISWKLTGENDFIETIEQQEKNLEKTSQYYQLGFIQENLNYSSLQNSVTDTFHIMISYSWKNKILCHQIYEYFRDDGYRVWIDENDMYGSIIERMAEAIEKSNFILICVSSDYKKSANCQAEAEYAFKRKKTIIPLIVEPNYKADGWLSFIIGNKIYINFTDRVHNEFKIAYKMLLVELQHNGLDLLQSPTNSNCSSRESDTQKYVQPKPSIFESKLNTQPIENVYEPIPSISLSQYRHIERMDNWNETNVVEFFVDNDLKILLPILKGINGQGLIELYRIYERSPNNLYKMFRKDKQIISLGIFFKFVGILKKFINISEQHFDF